jgi:cysteine synthase
LDDAEIVEAGGKSAVVSHPEVGADTGGPVAGTAQYLRQHPVAVSLEDRF